LDKNNLNNIRESVTTPIVDFTAIGKYLYYGLQDQIYDTKTQSEAIDDED